MPQRVMPSGGHVRASLLFNRQSQIVNRHCHLRSRQLPDAAAGHGRRAMLAQYSRPGAQKNMRPHRRVIFHFFSRKFRIFPGRVFISPWLAASRFFEVARK
jgi:hypothetical protein